MARIDPADNELKKRATIYLNLCLDISSGFTALGISRILPACLLFLVNKKVARLYHFAAMTVRDVQFAIFNLGMTVEELSKCVVCPKAPSGPEPDPSLRRLKAVLTHPIGDYAVQPRDASMAAHGVTAAHYSGGAAYPVGNTQHISTILTSVVRDLGGEAFTNATVSSIIVENGRAVGVRVCSTAALKATLDKPTTTTEEASVPLVLTEVRAKNVVWASGIYNLYTNILPPSLPVVQAFQDPRKRTAIPSNGHVYLFVKLRGDAAELQLPDHNLW
jgi:hypothetical protein